MTEDVSLKEYMESRFRAQERAVEAAHATAERALVRSEAANEKRFDAVNEFRRTLADQAAQFMNKSEFLALHKAVEDKITAISRSQNMMTGGLILVSFAVGLFSKEWWLK